MARSWAVRPLHDWLLVTHLLVFVLPVVVLVGSGALARDLRRQTVDDIAHQAVMLALHIGAGVELREEDPELGLRMVAEGLSPLLETAKERTLAGYRVVDRTGAVIAASNGLLGGSMASDPEVMETIRTASNEWWEEARVPSRSAPLASASRRAAVRMFVAEPIVVRGRVLGAVVVSRTPREELQAFWHMAPYLSTGVALAFAMVVGLAVVSARVLSRSLRALSAASHRMAAGHLEEDPSLARARASRVWETRELAGALGTMATRLQVRLAYIGEFASHVSHEFKTPVSSLRGTVELLLDDDEMPPAQRERFLTNALSDLDRLTRMVTGLLQLARAEESGARQRVELADVVAGVLAQHPAVHLEGTAGAVDANPAQLAVAVRNLVENAERYGGPSAEVVVRLFSEGARVGIEVEDNGPGVSEANLPRVFDRFFTTGRERGGTGLGLALVQAVVEAHGGGVTVRSQPGCTVFRVVLPALLAAS